MELIGRSSLEELRNGLESGTEMPRSPDSSSSFDPSGFSIEVMGVSHLHVPRQICIVISP